MMLEEEERITKLAKTDVDVADFFPLKRKDEQHLFAVLWLIDEQVPQGLPCTLWAGNHFFSDSSRHTQVPKMGSIF